ncbi:MAG: response regulator transcription factor [Pseudomonadota bacterium]
MIRIALIDDHTMVRELLAEVLSKSGNIEVVAEFGSAEDLFEAIDGLTVDAIVIDIGLPGEDGIEATTRLRARGITTPILCLTMHLNRAMMKRALESGANGFAVKHDSYDDLTCAINAITSNQTYVTPALEEVAEAPHERMFDKLSPREREVVTLVASGWKAIEIADHLKISERTVDFHRRNIGEKTGLRRIADIVKFALDTGLNTNQ